MPRLRPRPWLVALIAATFAGAALFVAFGRIAFDGLDFAAGVYPAAHALWARVDPYDAVGLRAVFRSACPETPFLVQGYPPWYALAIAWLGLVPVDAAGRLWLVVNVALACAIVIVLTSRWSAPARIAAVVAAASYVPVLGSLRVGQYTVPVALGAALVVACVRGGSALAGGAGLALLTFKPHVGTLVALAAVPALWARHRRSLVIAVGIGLVLGAGSFLVSQSWPYSYPASALVLLRDVRNATCDTCASVVGILTHRGSRSLPMMPTMLAVIAAVGVLSYRATPEVRVAVAVVASALALPLFRSYDYVMLLVPLLVAAEHATGGGLVVLGIAWAAPALILLTDRSIGVHALWVSAVLVLLVLLASPGRACSRTAAASSDRGAAT